MTGKSTQKTGLWRKFREWLARGDESGQWVILRCQPAPVEADQWVVMRGRAASFRETRRWERIIDK